MWAANVSMLLRFFSRVHCFPTGTKQASQLPNLHVHHVLSVHCATPCCPRLTIIWHTRREKGCATARAVSSCISAPAPRSTSLHLSAPTRSNATTTTTTKARPLSLPKTQHRKGTAEAFFIIFFWCGSVEAQRLSTITESVRHGASF